MHFRWLAPTFDTLKLNSIFLSLKLFILVGWDRSFLSVAWHTGVQLMFFFSSGVSKLFGAQGSPSSGSLLNL